MKNVAIYQRSKSSEDGTTLLISECFRRDLNIVHIYSDTNCSAGTLDRPSLRTFIANLKHGYFDFLLIESMEQLTRNSQDLVTFLQLLEENNVELIILNGGGVAS